MKKIFTFAACVLLSAGMYAQDVDKATVEGQAAAAKNAIADLKSIDTGDKAWKFDGVLGLNAAATSLVNWAAGGKNNINGVAYAKLHLLYHKDAIAWETNLDTDFGMTWTDDKEDALKKSTDNIKLATKFGWEFKESWYLTVNAGFQSQYALGRKYQKGYDPIKSKWLAPSYTDISVGIDWKKSYNGADFSIFLSPLAGRITTAYIGEDWNKKYTYARYEGMLTDQLNNGEIDQTTFDALIKNYNYTTMVENYSDIRSDLQRTLGTFTYATKDMTVNGVNYKLGDPIYRSARAEFGLSFKGGIAYTYNDLKLSTTLGLFTPYQGKGFNVKEAYENSHPGETYDGYYLYSNNNRYFGRFDVDWDCSLSYQFLKCLQITLSTSLKYYNGTLIADKDGNEEERVQFKSILGIGVGYSF
ncbi:MAG: DUF3078 domain-containing protein [Paludibacteraceae bacterium]|nr:DUF3078 domain-containing protein [Paludibacteraceae bacterium]